MGQTQMIVLVVLLSILALFNIVAAISLHRGTERYLKLRREDVTKTVLNSINLNDMAQRIAEREGGKVEMPIAQIKEVMRLMLAELAALSVDDLAQLIRGRRK